MAKYSMKVKGKEIGPASTYAQPHDMEGHLVDGKSEHPPYNTECSARDTNMSTPIASGMGIGRTMEAKTSGIEMRGYGAATKGKMSRGPMA
jgi:hypothetical protein